jgi:N-acetylmuramoyl-L-alanine amidase
MNIVISSGHGKLIRGASGYLDEVDEARKVVNKVAERMKQYGVNATVFHDDVSTSQNENLNRIVDFHNSKAREFDVSVHFNAYETTGSPMGTECLYVTQDALAGKMADAIAKASGLKNRGPKKRTDLFFLNNTDEKSILIEVCFVDSSADAGIYNAHLDPICEAICQAISGKSSGATTPPPTQPPPTSAVKPTVTVVIDPPNSVNLIVK